MKFINKALLIKNILVIGDLHIGYEHQIINAGVLTPKTQIKTLIKELEELIKKTNPKKIIFLGDIKHAFKFETEEKFRFRQVYEFLQKHFKKENIIFIKGNHDTIDYSFQNKIKDYHTEKDIAFVHGHKNIPEIFDKKIKTILMGHLHPSIIFHDKDTTKKENYKCFLKGSYKKKKIIILPSFLNISTGSPINYYDEKNNSEFSIIPRKNLLNFEVHVIGKNKIYKFGKVKKLLNA